MKSLYTLGAILSCCTPIVCAAAQPPAQVAGKTLLVLMNEVQMCTTEKYEKPTDNWFPFRFDVPLLLRFPTEGNSYTAPHPLNSDDFHAPDITVSYDVATDASEAYVKLENGVFSALVVLTFTSPDAGSAYVYWHEDGETRHMRNAGFVLREAHPYDPAIQLQGEGAEDGDPELLDDGLNDILSALQKRRCRNATERLYCKRLCSLIPTIMSLHNPSFTSPDYKGNTALHYACALSHTALVQWLVDHGADLNAVTEKGATVDACVSGPNAAAIRRILSRARNRKK